ncbi:MAG: transcriptional repressor [Oscillospiraceae bacterium]|nr:transcriptional repressor [Oscillospiraceae bacterium]
MVKSTKHFRKREQILAYLKETKSHPSAEMVFTRLKPEIPDLSLGTVYRNLSMFKQQGVIASLGAVNGVERFDYNTDPHVHFICSHCNRVLDMHTVAVPDELLQTAAKTSGGQVEACQLTFTGVCSECIAKQEKGGETA